MRSVIIAALLLLACTAQAQKPNWWADYAGYCSIWPMNEGSGTNVLDAGAAELHMGFVGSPTWTTRGTDGALFCTGTGQYAQRSGSFLNTLTQYTLAAWAKRQTPTSMIFPFSRREKDGTFEALVLYSDNKAYAQIQNAYVGGTITIPNNSAEWNHWVVTFNGGRPASNGLSVYLNGVALTNRTAAIPTATAFSATSPFRIGQSGQTPGSVTGYVSGVLFSTNYFTLSQITNLYYVSSTNYAASAVASASFLPTALRRHKLITEGSP